jgi:hypothetical protein
MQRLRGFLFEAPSIPLWRYCLWASALSLLPSLAFGIIARFALAAAGIDTSGLSSPGRGASQGDVLTSTTFAPALETALLACGLELLSIFTQRRAIIVAAPAIVWGSLHAMSGVLRFFTAGWSFFVFSCSYLVWRPSSLWKAFAAAAIPHALGNLSAYALIGIAEYARHV